MPVGSRFGGKVKREARVWSAEVWVGSEEVQPARKRGVSLGGCDGDHGGPREDSTVKDGRDLSVLMDRGALGEGRDQERMVATDRTGPRRGQRDGAVGGQFSKSRGSSASETTGWSGPLGQSGSLQAHMVSF